MYRGGIYFQRNWNQHSFFGISSCLIFYLSISLVEAESQQVSCEKYIPSQSVPSYSFCKKLLPWQDARKHCENIHADLLTIETREEKYWLDDVIDDNFNDTALWWVGLLNIEGQWMWLDGNPLDTTIINWTESRGNSTSENHADLNCVEIKKGHLNPISCKSNIIRGFICKSSPIRTSTPIFPTTLRKITSTSASEPPHSPEALRCKSRSAVIALAVLLATVSIALIVTGVLWYRQWNRDNYSAEDSYRWNKPLSWIRKRTSRINFNNQDVHSSAHNTNIPDSNHSTGTHEEPSSHVIYDDVSSVPESRSTFDRASSTYHQQSKRGRISSPVHENGYSGKTNEQNPVRNLEELYEECSYAT